MIWLDTLSRWLKGPKPVPLLREEFLAARDRQLCMAALGWRYVLHTTPPAGERVEFTRDGCLTFIQSWEMLPLEYNVEGLWWRPLRAASEGEAA